MNVAGYVINAVVVEGCRVAEVAKVHGGRRAAGCMSCWPAAELRVTAGCNRDRNGRPVTDKAVDGC
jgi:hypothetical protein